MNNEFYNRFEMFIRLYDFLKDHNAELAVNPVISTLKTNLKTLIDDITTQAGTSSSDISGFSQYKDEKREALETSMLKVGSALSGYFLANGSTVDFNPRDYSQRNLTRMGGGNLFLKAEQLHEAAEPVKALLAPYCCTAADVDTLATHKDDFFDAVELPKTKRTERALAGRELCGLMKQATVLAQHLDVYLAVYESVNRTLYDRYRSARHVIKRGGKKKKKEEEEV